MYQASRSVDRSSPTLYVVITITNKSHHFSHPKIGIPGKSRAPRMTQATTWSVTFATASLHKESPMIPTQRHTLGHVSHVDIPPRSRTIDWTPRKIV